MNLVCSEVATNNQELKHLGFVKIAANLYEPANQNSGPLRSAVGMVEGSGYEKFKGVPNDLLVFVNNKVFLSPLSLLIILSFLSQIKIHAFC